MTNKLLIVVRKEGDSLHAVHDAGFNAAAAYGDSLYKFYDNIDSEMINADSLTLSEALSLEGLAPSEVAVVDKPDLFIAKCLTGEIDASQGAYGSLGEGVKLFVQAPIPDLPSPNATFLQDIPDYDYLIDAKGWVRLQNEDGYYPLGANTFSGSRGTGFHIGNSVAGLRAFNSDWKTGGYFAMIYI